mmetsp:Transcript_23015/g.59034  ORF Transcript_23015/g.59034 Transcript_23015/m.59034 type:complete len:350 (+) Transcript_23015:663-1712(+)
MAVGHIMQLLDLLDRGAAVVGTEGLCQLLDVGAHAVRLAAQVALRQGLAGLNAVDDVGDDRVQVWARVHNAHVGAELIEVRAEVLLAGVEDQIPASLGEVKALQEKLQHGGVAHRPDEVHAAGVAVRPDDAQRRRDADAARNEHLVVKVDGVVVGARKGALHPDRPHGVALQRGVHRCRPVARLEHEHLPARRVHRVLKQREGVPLVFGDPGQADVGKPALLAARCKGRRHRHRHLHAARQHMEGGGVDLLRHDEKHVEGVQGVPADADAQDVGNEAAVGHRAGWDMEAHADGKEVEEVMQGLPNLIAERLFKVHHRERDQRRGQHDHQAGDAGLRRPQKADVAVRAPA